MSDLDPSAALPRPVKNLILILAGLAVVIGMVVIVGWAFSLRSLTQIHPTFNTMKFNTALCFVLSGLSLIGIILQWKALRSFLSTILVVVSGLVLCQYFLGITNGVDQFFIRDQFTDPAQWPGRMAPQTAVCFFLFGCTLLSERLWPQRIFLFLRALTGCFLLVIGSTAIFGFIFKIPFAYTWGSYNALALHTAIGFMLVGTGLMLTSYGKIYLPLLATFLLGLSISLQTFFSLKSSENTLMLSQFTTESKDRFAAINKEFLSNYDKVIALRAFYDSSSFVERGEFEKFTQSIMVAEDYQTIHALQWIPRVKQEEVPEYIERAQKDGFQNFTLRELTPDHKQIPAAPRDEYFVTYYIEPFGDNQEVFGLDLGSHPLRAKYMSEARRSGQVTATEPLDLLVQKKNKNPRGFLIFAPVYPDAPLLSSAEWRWESIKGFVIGIFNASDIVEHALKTLNPVGIDIYVYDAGAARGNMLLYYYPSPRRSTADLQIQVALQDIAQMKNIHYSEKFMSVGREMVILSVPTTVYKNRFKTIMPILFLWIILAFTILIVFYLYLEMRKRFVIEQMVVNRTQELNETNRKLKTEMGNRQLAEQKKEEALKVKSEFISVVSHELRTPLTVIKGGVDAIIEEVTGPVSAEQKDLLTTVKRNVDRLSRLINDVLDYQKLESGRMQFQMEKNEIHQFLKGIVSDFVPAAREHGIALVCQVPNQEVYAVFDKDRIAQVVINLINNAIKFTDRGEIIVKTEIRKQEVCVSVKDSGIGIKKEDMPKLFKNFSQIGEQGERKTGGTGLGLSIVQRIIREHHGQVSVESVHGSGTTFSFTLPLAERNA